MASPNKTQLALIPALEPPVGTTPDFSPSYSGLQPVFIAILSLCLIVTTLIIGARLVAKRFGVKAIQVEDYVVVVAWLGFVGWVSFNLVAARAGLGRHQWNVTALQMSYIAKLTYIDETLYTPVVVIAKIALLLQYMRVFVTSRQGFTYIAIHVLIWGNIIVYLFSLFWLLFGCSPREKNWIPTIPGKCLNPNANLVFTGSWNVLSDFLIFALPLYTIWGLHMSVQRKLQISGVFAVGLFGCISSICRLYFGAIKILHESDLNFSIIKGGLWSCSEIAMILICSSLPLLPKFFTLLFNRNTGLPSYTSSAKRGSSSRQNQGKSSKYSNSLATNIGVPWEHTNTSTSQLRNTYVPLKELEPSHSRYTEVSGSNVGGECASSESEAIRGDTHCNTITKTVKIECI